MSNNPTEGTGIFTFGQTRSNPHVTCFTSRTDVRSTSGTTTASAFSFQSPASAPTFTFGTGDGSTSGTTIAPAFSFGSPASAPTFTFGTSVGSTSGTTTAPAFSFNVTPQQVPQSRPYQPTTMSAPPTNVTFGQPSPPPPTRTTFSSSSPSTTTAPTFSFAPSTNAARPFAAFGNHASTSTASISTSPNPTFSFPPSSSTSSSPNSPSGRSQNRSNRSTHRDRNNSRTSITSPGLTTFGFPVNNTSSTCNSTSKVAANTNTTAATTTDSTWRSGLTEEEHISHIKKLSSIEQCEKEEEILRRLVQQVETRKQHLAREQIDSTLCVICQDEKKTIVLLPCKHLCLCDKCCGGNLLKNCPLCRREISDRMKVIA